MCTQLCSAVIRGDLAEVRSLIENSGGNVNEKGEVRYVAASVGCGCVVTI